MAEGAQRMVPRILVRALVVGKAETLRNRDVALHAVTLARAAHILGVEVPPGFSKYVALAAHTIQLTVAATRDPLPVSAATPTLATTALETNKATALPAIKPVEGVVTNHCLGRVSTA